MIVTIYISIVRNLTNFIKTLTNFIIIINGGAHLVDELVMHLQQEVRPAALRHSVLHFHILVERRLLTKVMKQSKNSLII